MLAGPKDVTYHCKDMAHISCDGVVDFFLGWRADHLSSILFVGE